MGVLLVLSALPIGRTLLTSVRTTSAQDGSTEFTLAHYRAAYLGEPVPKSEDAGASTSNTAIGSQTMVTVAPPAATAAERMRVNLHLLGNSLGIAAVAALLALLLGVPYAYLVERTDLPLRGPLGLAVLFPLVLPPLLIGIAWTFIPAFEPAPLKDQKPDLEWGTTLTLLRAGVAFALCYFPIVVLFARRALRQVPGALEESARMVAGPWAAFRKVTLPLIAPGTLAGALFVFVFAMNDFSLVDFLNWVRPTGDRVSVFPYQSFVAWTTQSGYGSAVALGLPLAVIGCGMLLVIHRLIGRRPRASIGGAHRAPARIELGAWRWPAFGAVLALLAVSVGVPFYGLVSKAGGVKTYQVIWSTVAGSTSSTHEVAWTLWHATVASAIAVPLAFVLSHRLARKGGAWLSLLALLPLALPPVFLAIGYVRITSGLQFTIPGVVEHRNPFIDSDSPRFATSFLMVAKYVSFAVAALWASFLEVDPSLEEVAATAGVRPLDRALGILVPLVRPALALSVVLVFVFCLREIDSVVLLGSDTVMHKIYTAVHFARDNQVAALSVMLVVMQTIPFALLALFSDRASRPAAADADPAQNTTPAA